MNANAPRAARRGVLLRLAAQMLIVCLVAKVHAAGAAQAPGDEAMRNEFERARALAGVDAVQARALIATLRKQATASGQAVWRLALDELDCRLLTDVDMGAARDVASAGIAVAPAGAEPQLPLLRLKACRAGAAIDLGDERAGNDELEAILQASAKPSLAPAHAMALLERGLRRSRRGDLTHGQEDLLSACGTFTKLALHFDQELCLSHLANHQKRAGDYDEALSTLAQLLDSARRRKARQDEGIYLYNTALVHADREDWAQALKFYADALAIETQKDDATGIAYAEHGMADALLHQGRPTEALTHVQNSLRRLVAVDEPVQAARSAIVKASALATTGRAAEASDILAGADAAVRAAADDYLRVGWLRAQSEVQAKLGHWREAYEALATARETDVRLQAQKQSRQLARLRLQFSREKDESAIRALEQANEQGHRLRQVQAVALTLFVLLLLASLVYALHKFREARRLRTLALNDDLTGLPNRRAVFAHAQAVMQASRSRASPLSVLMIDVDHFKGVNDEHGHGIGDQVLKLLATLLPASLRGRDQLGRIGGEEFLAVLPDASLEQAVAIAERMRQGVASAPLRTDAGELGVTISIGAASIQHGDTVASLVARADRALYAAKSQGRNLVTAAVEPAAT